MDPGSVASDKSLAATEPGGRASASRQGGTDHVRRGYPHRGTLRNQSKLRSLDAVLLWPGAMVREWERLPLSLSPVKQAWSTAAGASKRQLGHAAQGWACIQDAGSRSVGGRLCAGPATSRRAPKRCAPPTRVRAQPCRRHGVSAQRRRRPDRCVASPSPPRLGVPRCPCLGRPVFDGCARLSQCTQPQPARTAPRRLGRQCVRGGAGVSRTVVAAHTATTHPPVTLGSKIPDVELSYFDSEHQLQRLSTKDLCSGKKARRLTVSGCCRPPFTRRATVGAHTGARALCAGGAVCGAWRVHADLQVRVATPGWPCGEALYCRPSAAP